MFTGGVEVYYDAMIGDKAVGTYRTSYYGGERYAHSEAEHQIEKVRFQAANEERAKRQAKAAKYAAKSKGGQGMSAIDEAKTRYNTAVDNIVNAVANLNGAMDDLESARSACQGELQDSQDSDAQRALEGFDTIEEAIKQANVGCSSTQEYLENLRDSL